MAGAYRVFLKRSSVLDLNQTFVEDDDEDSGVQASHPDDERFRETTAASAAEDCAEGVCSSGTSTDERREPRKQGGRVSRSHSAERAGASKNQIEEERREERCEGGFLLVREPGRRSLSPTPSPGRRGESSPITEDSLTSPPRRYLSRQSSEKRRKSPQKPVRKGSPVFSGGGTEVDQLRPPRDYRKRPHKEYTPSLSPPRSTHRSKRSYSRSPPIRGSHYSSRSRFSPEGRYLPRKRSPPSSRPRKHPWTPPPNRSTGLGKPGRDLFIAGFSFDTTERDLERKFSRYGRVRDVRIVRDKRSGNSRGFGFLSLGRDEDADAAIRGLDKTEWNGRIVLVEKVKSPN